MRAVYFVPSAHPVSTPASNAQPPSTPPFPIPPSSARATAASARNWRNAVPRAMYATPDSQTPSGTLSQRAAARGGAQVFGCSGPAILVVVLVVLLLDPAFEADEDDDEDEDD